MNKTVNTDKAWWLRAAGARTGGLQRHHTADDRGQLFAVQETFGDNVFFWAGTALVRAGLALAPVPCLRWAGSSFFTGTILAIEVPLGVIGVALAMPRKGPWVSVCLVLMALPLLDSLERGRRHVEHLRHCPRLGLLGNTLNYDRNRLQLYPPSAGDPPGSPRVV